MLTTLMVPSTSPPSASVAPKISASSVSSQSIGSQRRCVSQNSMAMISGRPAHRMAHVVLHARGDFLHENRTAGVAHHDAFPISFFCSALAAGHDRVMDFSQLAHAR
jgi:hypothetical protein